MDKKLYKYILDIVMATIGKALSLASFKKSQWSEAEIKAALKDMVDQGYLLAVVYDTEGPDGQVVLVNNVTEKGLKLAEELRGE